MAAGLKSRAYLRTVPLYDRVHYNIFFCLCFIVFARTENGSVLLTVRIRRRGEVDVYVWVRAHRVAIGRSQII